jgi:hypothetical protein
MTDPQSQTPSVAPPSPKKSIPFLPVIVVLVLALIAYFAIPKVIEVMESQEHAKKKMNIVGTGNGTPPEGYVPPMTGGPPPGVGTSGGSDKKPAESDKGDEKAEDAKSSDEQPKE